MLTKGDDIMAQTNLSIRIDEELKHDFDLLCEDMGMSMTTAICIFAKRAVSEQRIPFDVTANDPFYSPANRERLLRSARQMDETGGTVHDIEVEVDD